jgi:hypothetical protein
MGLAKPQPLLLLNPTLRATVMFRKLWFEITRPKHQPKPRRAYPRLEMLEERLTPTAFPRVTSLTPSLTTINERGSIDLSGTIVDQGPAGAHNLTIYWGDGTTTAVTLASGVTAFSGISHPYANNQPGDVSFPIHATVVNTGDGLSSAPVSWYTGDGTTDDLMGKNNGSIQGAVSYAPGTSGEAFQFNGSDDVSVPYSTSLALHGYTVSAWVNLAATPFFGNGIVGTRFGGDNTFDVKVDSNKVHGDVGNGTSWISTTVDYNATLAPGTWYQVTYVIDNNGKIFNLYLNGALQNTIAFTGTPLFMTPKETMEIGCTDTGFENFNGLVDELQIYGRALSANEVKNLFSGGMDTQVTVHTIAPEVTNLAVSPTAIGPGNSATLSGTVFDLLAQDSHAVTAYWGDGTTSTFNLAGGSLAFNGVAHQYATGQPGTYTIRATVTDTTDGLSSAPLSWYTGDGTANDLMGNNSGAAQGSVTYASGSDGQAFQFNGTDDISVPYSPSLALNSYTVSAWVNLAATPFFGNGIISTRFGGDNTFDVKVASNKVHGDVGNGTSWISNSVDYDATLTPGSWYLVTYVIDNNAKAFSLYLNGALQNTIPFSGTPLFMTSGETMEIGCSLTGFENFNGLIDEAQIYSRPLSAADVQNLFAGGPYAQVTIEPTASSFKVRAFPSPSTAGTTHQFTVSALNFDGTVDKTYTGTVSFTSSDGQAILPASYQFTAADHGVHTFAAALKTAGTQSLTVTDTALSTVTGSQTNITVNPALLARFSVTGFPSPTLAGTAQQFNIAAEDRFGNVITGYLGTVTFASSDRHAVLPAPYTFGSADQGVHTFTATLETVAKAGQTISVIDTNNIAGKQTGIMVTPAVASRLRISGAPASIIAGTSFAITVAALDPYGNIATDYTGTVHFTSIDPQAVLPADYTFTPVDSGVHTFSATLVTAGTRKITSQDKLTASITGSTPAIAVNAAAASHFKVVAPATVTSGKLFSITVTALDPYGNVVTGFTGTVHFTTTDPSSSAILPSNYAFTSADKGKHVFTSEAKLITPGSQEITGTDTGNNSITGSASVTVDQPETPGVILFESVKAKKRSLFEHLRVPPIAK